MQKHPGMKTCTSHHIKCQKLITHVLADLQEVITYARNHEAEFTAKIEKQTKQEKEKAKLAVIAEHKQATERIAELNRMIDGLLDLKLKGDISDERFAKTLPRYEDEQKALEAKVNALETSRRTQAEHETRAGRFLTLVRQYTDISELTHELAAAFIRRIYLHKAEKVNGERVQIVEVEYNIIGKFDD
jgi:hypothetical protein